MLFNKLKLFEKDTISKYVWVLEITAVALPSSQYTNVYRLNGANIESSVDSYLKSFKAKREA